MSDSIIILKAKRRISFFDLDNIRNVLLHQMKDGVMVVPDYLEVTVVNSEQLDCEIEEVEDESQRNDWHIKISNIN